MSRYYWLALVVLLTFCSRAMGADLVAVPASTQPMQSLEDGQESRLTLKLFPKNLGRNFVGLFNNRNLAPLLAGIAISGAARQFDRTVERYFEDRNPDTFFSNAGSQAGKSHFVGPAIGAVFLTGLYTGDERLRSFSYALAQAYVLNAGIKMSMKELTGRVRPNGSNSRSFPSGHSADAFMIATVIDQYYGHKAGFVAYGFAAFIATSRLKSNVHWLSDVTAGATIGYIIGRSVSHSTGGLNLSRHVQVEPAINLFQKQYGVSFTIHLP